MKFTPVFQFPYVEDGDRARDYPATTRQMVEAIEAALLDNGRPPVGSDVASLLAKIAGIQDSGWKTVAQAGASLGDGFTAKTAIQYKTVGGFVALAGEAYRATAPTAEALLFTLPAGFRPNAATAFVPGILAWDHYTRVNGSNGGVYISANQARTSSTGYALGNVSLAL